jgi:hypothetical protein
MSFQKIFTDGNLVDVDVSIWTAMRKLTPEDLGLNENDFSNTISLGSKKLIPAEAITKLKRYESRTRNMLIDYSFPFAFGGARFIPKKKFLQFAQKMELLIQDFNLEADNLVKHYASYKIHMRQEYTELATRAYKRKFKLDRKSIEGRGRKSLNVFIDNFLSRIEECYPHEDDIRSKFRISYTVYKVDLPDLSQAKMDDIIEEDEKYKIMEEVYRENLQRQVNDFVKDTTYRLRGRAEKVLTRLHKILTTDGKISEATMTSIRNMVDDYACMNFVEDDDFTALLQRFQEKWIDPYTAKKILTDKNLKKRIVIHLDTLIKHVNDKAKINWLIQKYQRKIK